MIVFVLLHFAFVVPLCPLSFSILASDKTNVCVKKPSSVDVCVLEFNIRVYIACDMYVVAFVSVVFIFGHTPNLKRRSLS